MKMKIQTRTRRARKTKRTLFGRMERLEGRAMLAVSIVRTTENQRFTIDDTSIDKSYVEYQAFQVTNTSGAPLTNLWVKATGFDVTEKVQLAPNEDGLYYLGDLAAGASDTAFFYFQATAASTTTPDPQTYTIEVWDHAPPLPDPAIPGDAPIDSQAFEFLWVAAADENNDGSVTETVGVSYSSGGMPVTAPVVGGEMTITVTGEIKNNADRVLFMPATSLDWPADTFELRHTNVSIDGVPLGDDIIWQRFPDRQKRDFVAIYTFAINGTTASPTPVTPREYTASGDIGNRKFDHSRLLDGVADIPPAVYETALEITKTGTATAVAGAAGLSSYTITVTSSGLSDSTGVVVTDTWPAEFTKQAITPPAGTTITAETATGFTWTIGTLAAGTSKSLTVNFTVPGTTAPGVYTNTAVVASTTPNPNPDTASASTTVVDVPLTISKSPDATVIAGSASPRSYSIVVTNTSGFTAEGVVVTDVWPAALNRQPIIPPAGTTIIGATPSGFTWNIGTMTAGQSYTLVVNYTVPKATLSGTYTNTATVSSTTANPNTKTASATTTVFDLLLSKTADATTVVAGSSSVHSFTMTVQNTSPTLDLTDVVVNDTWPVPFVIGSFTGPGTVTTIGTNFRWTLATLARNSSATLLVTYTVPKTTPLVSYTNVATVTSTQGTPVPNTASTSVTVVGIDLTITKVGDAATVQAGSTGHWYRITVTNTSPLHTAENVTVTDTWPTGFTQVSFSDPGAVAPLGGGNFLWTIGNLAPLATAQLQVNFDVPSSAVLKLYSNVATVNSATQDPGPKTAEADTLVVAASLRAGVVICTDDGCSPAWVRVLDADGNLISEFQPYGAILGGLRVTAADVTGDGVEEIIVAPGLGVRKPVRVLTATGAPVPGFADFYPYGATWRNGIELTAADVNNDGREDIITGMSLGVGTVKVYISNGKPTLFRSFRGAPAGYAGGVRIAAADFGTYQNGVLVSPTLDGKAEVAVGTNAGITAQVRIFDVQPKAPVLARTIVPFGKAFKGGVTLSTGNYDGDPAHVPDILVGAGIGGRSVVKVFNAQTGTLLTNGSVTAFSSFAKANAVVNVAPLDTDFDGTIDSLYGVQGRSGAGGTPGVRRVVLPSFSATELTTYAAPMRIAPISLSAALMSRAGGVRVR